MFNFFTPLPIHFQLNLNTDTEHVNSLNITPRPKPLLLLLIFNVTRTQSIKNHILITALIYTIITTHTCLRHSSRTVSSFIITVHTCTKHPSRTVSSICKARAAKICELKKIESFSTFSEIYNITPRILLNYIIIITTHTYLRHSLWTFFSFIITAHTCTRHRLRTVSARTDSSIFSTAHTCMRHPLRAVSSKIKECFLIHYDYAYLQEASLDGCSLIHCKLTMHTLT